MGKELLKSSIQSIREQSRRNWDAYIPGMSIYVFESDLFKGLNVIYGVVAPNLIIARKKIDLIMGGFAFVYVETIFLKKRGSSKR